jgi:hypothetical protein
VSVFFTDFNLSKNPMLSSQKSDLQNSQTIKVGIL